MTVVSPVGVDSTTSWGATREHIDRNRRTGYTRTMMAGVLENAAHQGYAPDCVVCAGETPRGRRRRS